MSFKQSASLKQWVKQTHPQVSNDEGEHISPLSIVLSCSQAPTKNTHTQNNNMWKIKNINQMLSLIICI